MFPNDLTHASLFPPLVPICPEIGLNWPPTGPPLAPNVAGPCPGVSPVDRAASSVESHLCLPLNCRISLTPLFGTELAFWWYLLGLLCVSFCKAPSCPTARSATMPRCSAWFRLADSFVNAPGRVPYSSHRPQVQMAVPPAFVSIQRNSCIP